MSRLPVSEAAAREVLAVWSCSDEVVLRPFGTGLINDTFAVDDGDARFVLQRLHTVFAPEIHHNIEAVTRRLADCGVPTPRLIPTRLGTSWAEDRQGRAWRMLTRMPGVTFEAVESPGQAHSAARLLARFHGALEGLDHDFVGLRKNVHDTAAHLSALESAVADHPDHRLAADVAALADAILEGARRLPVIEGVPDRIVHGDPKFNNVLFESPSPPGSERAMCMIDLDTVAPMALHLELGDAWRSWCNRAGENRQDAVFDHTIFEASLSGYASGQPRLTSEEVEALVYGVEWITLELAARFAADALVERYFGWDRTRFPGAGEHNLLRARGQWSLHTQVVDRRAERARLVAATLGARKTGRGDGKGPSQDHSRK